jgi:hypothetical protein
MNSDIAGKYIHQKTGTNYLELKPDGNYFLFDGTAGITGAYEVNGTEITIFAADSASRATIQGGVITDDEGDQWILAKAVEEAGKYPKCPNCNADLLDTARFCSNCGAEVNPARGTSPPAASRTSRPAAPAITKDAKRPVRERIMTADDPLESMTWLPPSLRRPDFPWELIEAGAWLVIMIIGVIAVITNKR